MRTQTYIQLVSYQTTTLFNKNLQILGEKTWYPRSNPTGRDIDMVVCVSFPDKRFGDTPASPALDRAPAHVPVCALPTSHRSEISLFPFSLSLCMCARARRKRECCALVKPFTFKICKTHAIVTSNSPDCTYQCDSDLLQVTIFVYLPLCPLPLPPSHFLLLKSIL